MCILIEGDIKYSTLSKEIIMNLIEFARKVEAKNILLLIEKKNKDYIKILQGMMTVGFVSDTASKLAKINDSTYKVLRMEVKPEGNIEEISI